MKAILVLCTVVTNRFYPLKQTKIFVMLKNKFSFFLRIQSPSVYTVRVYGKIVHACCCCSNSRNDVLHNVLRVLHMRNLDTEDILLPVEVNISVNKYDIKTAKRDAEKSPFLSTETVGMATCMGNCRVATCMGNSCSPGCRLWCLLWRLLCCPFSRWMSWVGSGT